MTTPQFQLPNPPSDAISAIKFAPSSLRLLVASWDKNVYQYELAGGSGHLQQKFEHRAPVLDVCWGENEDVAYSAGLDWDVREINLRTGVQNVLSSHTAGVKSLVYSASYKLLMSTSWDSTLHIHHVSEPNKPPSKVSLPHKPFSMSTTATKLVIAMASRTLYIYELESLARLSVQTRTTPHSQTEIENAQLRTLEIDPWQRRESSLKFMTRAVAGMPNDAGYVTASIEGRVAVEWFDPSTTSQARKYAFKCHRQPSPSEAGVDIVYPVNALAYHPVHGTFASGGGDGFVALWDGVAKRRIRQYQRFPSSVAAVAFDSEGKWLAVGVGPGFEDAMESDPSSEVMLFVRELGDGEAKAKGKEGK